MAGESLGCGWEKGIPQGLKPLFVAELERAKPEGLAYLDAKGLAYLDVKGLAYLDAKGLG